MDVWNSTFCVTYTVLVATINKCTSRSIYVSAAICHLQGVTEAKA